MRLSSNPKHPDYSAALLPCRVYLDDVEVKECLYLDTNEGYVVCAAHDESGGVYLKGGEIATDVHYGAVRVEKMTRRGGPIPHIPQPT